MGFLAPWFLGGLAALGVPVFVHLLRRHKATPRPVSSLMFFERGTQSSTRHRRLRYLVLFALRCALVLLVVLAFANPYIWRSEEHTSELQSRLHLVCRLLLEKKKKKQIILIHITDLYSKLSIVV